MKKRKRRRKNRVWLRLLFLIIIIIGVVIFIPKDKTKGTECKEVNNILLVNKNNPVDETYEPENLVIPNVPISESITLEEKKVDKSIESSLEELFNAARNDGYDFYLLSGYRSYGTQKNVYSYNKKQNGEEYAERYVAQPGKSEHQTGLALDVTNYSHNFRGSEEAYWLENNAYKYGFIIRYPKDKEDITGYNYEPWHIRYVGKDNSQKMHEKNECLEKFLNSN